MEEVLPRVFTHNPDLRKGKKISFEKIAFRKARLCNEP